MEYSYKGITSEINLNYREYDIGSPINVSFRPYFGNKLLNIPTSEVEKVLKRKVRYEINKRRC
jgi:hypothetical protein